MKVQIQRGETNSSQTLRIELYLPLAEKQNRYALKSANKAKISRRLFKESKKDLTWKKEKDVSRGKVM